VTPGLIPNEWRASPPQALAIGNGPYTIALATVLGIASAPLALLNALSEPNERGGHIRLLDDLERVFLVVSEGMSAAEALGCHQIVWGIVAKLSSAGDHHDLACLFILPADAPRSYEESLAIGLAVPEIDPATTGHGVWRRSGSLSELLDLAASIKRMDLPPLRGRQARDTRHAALAKLRAAVAQDDPSAANAAAQEVLASFSGHEYHLDLFCRPPRHPHGNLLRTWLSNAVTSPITHGLWATRKPDLADWLT
jgi:hypothetical protein